MSTEQERARLLAVMMEDLGPSRWHPFRRRKWRRWLGSAVGSSHWSSLATVEAAELERIKARSDAVCADLSERVPDGYEFRYEWPTTEDLSARLQTPRGH